MKRRCGPSCSPRSSKASSWSTGLRVAELASSDSISSATTATPGATFSSAIIVSFVLGLWQHAQPVCSAAGFLPLQLCASMLVVWLAWPFSPSFSKACALVGFIIMTFCCVGNQGSLHNPITLHSPGLFSGVQECAGCARLNVCMRGRICLNVCGCVYMCVCAVCWPCGRMAMWPCGRVAPRPRHPTTPRPHI